MTQPEPEIGVSHYSDPPDIIETSSLSSSTMQMQVAHMIQHADANANSCAQRPTCRPDSPSVLSSCMSDAAAEEGENASFCDPFSDVEEEQEEASQDNSTRESSDKRHNTSKVDAAIANPSPHLSRVTAPRSRPRSTSARISVADEDFSTTVIPSVAMSTALDTCSCRNVVRRASTNPNGILPPPPEAAELIAISSWSEADDVPNGTIPGVPNRRGCCCFNNGAAECDYDCICQHSCSSSISSLGSPDVDPTCTDEDNEGDDSSSASRSDNAAGSTNMSSARSTPRNESKQHALADVHDELMNVFNTHHREANDDEDGETCVADDEGAGCWDQDDDSHTSNDSLSTIEMEFFGEGAGTTSSVAISPVSNVDLPAVVRLYDSSTRSSAQLTRPTLSHLSLDLTSELSFSSATDRNEQSYY